jgi:hypothetical protein
MKNQDFEAEFTTDEIRDIEKSCQHNIEQFCMNRRVALNILGFDKEELCKRVASDPQTYQYLLKSLEQCMETLKAQVEILETTQARLIVALGERVGVTGDMH